MRSKIICANVPPHKALYICLFPRIGHFMAAFYCFYVNYTWLTKRKKNYKFMFGAWKCCIPQILIIPKASTGPTLATSLTQQSIYTRRKTTKKKCLGRPETKLFSFISRNVKKWRITVFTKFNSICFLSDTKKKQQRSTKRIAVTKAHIEILEKLEIFHLISNRQFKMKKNKIKILVWCVTTFWMFFSPLFSSTWII